MRYYWDEACHDIQTFKDDDVPGTVAICKGPFVEITKEEYDLRDLLKDLDGAELSYGVAPITTKQLTVIAAAVNKLSTLRPKRVI